MIRSIQRTDSADHEGLASLLWADCDTVGDGTAQDLRHCTVVFGRLEIQPAAVDISFKQSLTFQAAADALTDTLNQGFQLALGRRVDAAIWYRLVTIEI